MHPPVRSSNFQSWGDFTEKLSMQAQDGCALPLQTVKGPQVAGGVQGSAGSAFMVCQDCLACDQIFSLIWPEMSSETNMEDVSFFGEAYM